MSADSDRCVSDPAETGNKCIKAKFLTPSVNFHVQELIGEGDATQIDEFWKCLAAILEAEREV